MINELDKIRQRDQWLMEEVTNKFFPNTAEKDRHTLVRMIDALQAKLDGVMLEYCPDEMSQEQFDTWARNQIAVMDEAVYGKEQ